MRKTTAVLVTLVMTMLVGVLTTPAANAAGVVVTERHNFSRARDDGLVTHSINMVYAHKKVRGTPARYHWVQAINMLGAVNLNGSRYDCGPDIWDGKPTYRRTLYSVHVFNDAGKEWERQFVVHCDNDTKATSGVRRLIDTPGIRWRRGTVHVKVFIFDFYESFWGVQKINEFQFQGQLPHVE